MKAGKDRRGQITIDFLIGTTIFLVAFIYLLSTIPSLFTPFQSNSDELTMMADRVGTLLVENVLPAQSPSGPLVSIINITDFNDTANYLNSDGTLKASDNPFGLDPGDGYHVQLVLQEGDTTIKIPANAAPGNQNVGQSRRFVWVRYPDANGASNYPGLKAILMVRVW